MNDLEARKQALRKSWSDFAEHYVGISRANGINVPYRLIVPTWQFLASGCRPDWPTFLILESGERVRVQGESGIYKPVICQDTGFYGASKVERMAG